MRLEGFECDGCGKSTKLDKDAVGWLDLAEVVLATRKDQPRWQFCSPLCLGIFAFSYRSPEPVKEEGSLVEKWRKAFEGVPSEHVEPQGYL